MAASLWLAETAPINPIVEHLMKVTYTSKDYRDLLERARQAHANGDREAKYVIAWMENLLKPVRAERLLGGEQSEQSSLG